MISSPGSRQAKQLSNPNLKSTYLCELFTASLQNRRTALTHKVAIGANENTQVCEQAFAEGLSSPSTLMDPLQPQQLLSPCPGSKRG